MVLVLLVIVVVVVLVLFARWGKRIQAADDAALMQVDGAPEGTVTVAGLDGLEVAGEGYRKANLRRLFCGQGMGEGGVIFRVAALEPEPTNKHDPNAVKVLVCGEHVGYVPREASFAVSHLCAAAKRRQQQPGAWARVWCDPSRGGWHIARVTLLTGKDGLGDDEDYAAIRAQKEKKHADETVRRDLGQVDGQWFGTYRQAVAELKRQDRLDDALSVAGRCIDAAERVAAHFGESPVQWPTEQASTIYRKQKNHAAELAVLERYEAACKGQPLPDGIAGQLTRARAARTDGR